MENRKHAAADGIVCFLEGSCPRLPKKVGRQMWDDHVQTHTHRACANGLCPHEVKGWMEAIEREKRMQRADD